MANVKKVRFQGVEYWLVDDALLSQLDHWSAEGELLADPFMGEISFAVIQGGRILRYNECIGHVGDIEGV